jgi:hypothetical protein
MRKGVTVRVATLDEILTPLFGVSFKGADQYFVSHKSELFLKRKGKTPSLLFLGTSTQLGSIVRDKSPAESTKIKLTPDESSADPETIFTYETV